MTVTGILEIDDDSMSIEFNAELTDRPEERGHRIWDWTATASNRDGDTWYEGELIHNSAHSIASLGSKILMAVHMAMILDEADARSKTGND